MAILGVLFSHIGHLFEPGGPIPAARLRVVFSTFRLGVDLFFAISGFLITSLLMRQRSGDWTVKNWKATLAAFYARRAFRILPLVLTYVAALAAIKQVVPKLASNWELVSTVLFARNYLMHLSGGTATNHFWSLSVEEHFYLLWPPVFLAFGIRRGAIVAVAMALLVAIWRSVDHRYMLFQSLFGGDAGILFRTDTRCDALLWGGVAAIIAPRLLDVAKRWAAFPWTALVMTMLIMWNYLHLPLLSFALAVLFPPLVLSTVLRPTCVTSRFLEIAPLRWLGQRSYSLYVWQTLFLQGYFSFSRRAGSAPLKAIGGLFVDLALILVASLTTHRFIEIPAQRFGRGVAKRMSDRIAPESSGEIELWQG